MPLLKGKGKRNRKANLQELGMERLFGVRLPSCQERARNRCGG